MRKNYLMIHFLPSSGDKMLEDKVESDSGEQRDSGERSSSGVKGGDSTEFPS